LDFFWGIFWVYILWAEGKKLFWCPISALTFFGGRNFIFHFKNESSAWNLFFPSQLKFILPKNKIKIKIKIKMSGT
jgi:hypothetical protein